MLVEIMLAVVIVLSLCVAEARNLLKSLVFFSSSTIFVVIALFQLNAPDVALTEAVVGTGATTLLYLLAIKKIRKTADEFPSGGM